MKAASVKPAPLDGGSGRMIRSRKSYIPHGGSGNSRGGEATAGPSSLHISGQAHTPDRDRSAERFPADDMKDQSRSRVRVANSKEAAESKAEDAGDGIDEEQQAHGSVARAEGHASLDHLVSQVNTRLRVSSLVHSKKSRVLDDKVRPNDQGRAVQHLKLPPHSPPRDTSATVLPGSPSPHCPP